MTRELLVGAVVAATYARTWWYLWRRCFPEFRSRLSGCATFPLLALPVVALRMQSLFWALYVLGLAVVAGWVASRGRIERFFPKRWFHRTGEAPTWLTAGEIAAFWVLVALGCAPLYLALYG